MEQKTETTKPAASQHMPMLYSTDDPEGKMARLQPRTWRPINTAPKDGTWFIATWGTGGNRGYRLAAWSRYYREFVEVPRSRRIPFEMWTPLPEAP